MLKLVLFCTNCVELIQTPALVLFSLGRRWFRDSARSIFLADFEGLFLFMVCMIYGPIITIEAKFRYDLLEGARHFG